MKCLVQRCYRVALCAALLVVLAGIALPASAQEAFIGEIRLWSGNREPRGWMFCDGRTLPIRNYQALYCILGNTYGGDGRNTFQIPDLRGRFPIHSSGNNASNLKWIGFLSTGPSLPGFGGVLQALPGLMGQSTTTFAISKAGEGSAVTIAPPFLGLNHIICVYGIFPCRD